MVFGLWRKPPTLESFDTPLTREQLIGGSRIVVIDDEEPLIIEELKATGFSVDHDRTGNDLRNIDAQLYDVAIIDYHGVGDRVSPAQGLALMNHIKRVSPRTRRIAHTSKILKSTEADFFTSSHVVLPKDLGLAESLEIIEGQLRVARSKATLLEALLEKLALSDIETKKKVEEALVKALSKRDSQRFKEALVGLVGAAAQKAADKIIDKLF